MDAQEMLRKRGISLDEMVKSGFALFVGDEENRKVEDLKAEFRKKLEKNLADQNVGLLIAAAIHLDQMVGLETSGFFASSDDPEALVADELIGMSIAEYIAGKKGLFNYVRYDKEKPGILADLPPFLDDAVAALVAGTMTKLFED